MGGLHSQGPIAPAEEVEKQRRQRAAEAQAFLDDMEGLAAREPSTWPPALRILCQQREASAAEVTLFLPDGKRVYPRLCKHKKPDCSGITDPMSDICVGGPRRLQLRPCEVRWMLQRRGWRLR